MNKPKKIIKVSCPTCQTIVEWTAKQVWRPFCSERCQKIDFGDWASEAFTIAGEPALDEQHGEDV